MESHLVRTGCVSAVYVSSVPDGISRVFQKALSFEIALRGSQLEAQKRS